MSNDLKKKIEAILFYKAEPVSVQELARLTKYPTDAVEQAIDTLASSLSGHGLTLIKHNDEVTLGTASDVSDTIEGIAREDLDRDLGKAGLETLAIIAYQGPVTRADIDYIRGVNSSYILRNLLIRGLITRKPDPKNPRSFSYDMTTEFLAHLGISEKTELPEFEKIQKEFSDKQK